MCVTLRKNPCLNKEQGVSPLALAVAKQQAMKAIFSVDFIGLLTGC
jgi:hypothetical protein